MQSELYVHKREMVTKSQLGFVLWVTLGTLCLQDLLDVYFLFIQFLLGRVEIDKDNNVILLDLEMASMRHGRAFLTRINDNIPKILSSMEQMRGAFPLAAPRFESLILGMVYSAHQAKFQEREEDQEKWGEVLTRLAD
ncbi:unnamed protein product, partial [Coregonus sp. 'balchen']